MKQELKRIKTFYSEDVLSSINNLSGERWDNKSFSIKVETLLLIALAYQDYWEEHKVFDAIC